MTKFRSPIGVDIRRLVVDDTNPDAPVCVKFLFDGELTGDNEAKVYSYETDDAKHVKELDKLAEAGYMGITRADGPAPVIVEVQVHDYEKWGIEALRDEVAKRNDGRPDDAKIVVSDGKSKDAHVGALVADDANQS